MPQTDTPLISDPERLDRLPNPTRSDGIAVDTEFVRERTFHAQLGLVQLASDDEVLLLDPLATGMPNAIERLLGRCPDVIMHAAGEDLEALRVGCNALPRRLFDTQVAAALAGLGAGLSLQRLIEATVGVSLPKSETRTDWLRRPLSDAQRAYAADDVRYLGQAAAILLERLRALGREQWVAEDCQRMLEAAANDMPAPHPHLSFKPAQRFDAAAQLRVHRLLQWRELEARRSDRPRGWILDNALVARLAERPPLHRSQFERLLDDTPGAPRKHRDLLWDVLQREASVDEQALPLARAAEPEDRGRLKRLQSAVAGVAEELQLPDAVLASRRHLEALLADREWPDALAGWRRPLLEPALMAALD